MPRAATQHDEDMSYQILTLVCVFKYLMAVSSRALLPFRSSLSTVSDIIWNIEPSHLLEDYRLISNIMFQGIDTNFWRFRRSTPLHWMIWIPSCEIWLPCGSGASASAIGRILGLFWGFEIGMFWVMLSFVFFFLPDVLISPAYSRPNNTPRIHYDISQYLLLGNVPTNYHFICLPTLHARWLWEERYGSRFAGSSTL